MIGHFSLADLKIFSVFGFQHFDNDIYSCGILCMFLNVEFVKLLVYAGYMFSSICFSPDLGSFWPSFLQILFFCFYPLLLRLL